MTIKIREAKRVREELKLTHIIIYGVDEEGIFQMVTHGKTEKDAKQAAIAGNKLKKCLG